MTDNYIEMDNKYPLIVYLGIWSIATLNSLPGIAISPIMGDLQNVFPHAGEEQIQMLASLPSLLIIPFILLSGFLTQRVKIYKLLIAGLAVFGFTGLFYLFSTKMWQLLALSAMLGIGAGMVIPLSTGVVSLFFSGEKRTRQFGIVSAVSNLTVVIATSITAYLATINWRLPFVVYLIPFISLLFVIPLKKYWPDTQKKTETGNYNTENKENSVATVQNGVNIGENGIDVKRLLQIIALYFFSTFSACIIIFYIPFSVKNAGLSETFGGNLMSIFFIAIMLPGFFISKFMGMLKQGTLIYSILASLLAFLILMYLNSAFWMIISVCLLGLGYGLIQPLCYDKTSKVASVSKNAIALACLMTANYVAIVICPVLIDGIEKLFNIKEGVFPYKLGAFLFAIILLLVLYNRKSYVVKI